MTEFTPELISFILAGAVSLAFSLIPGLKDRFDALSPEYKQAVMGACTVIVGVAVPIAGCQLNLIELNCEAITVQSVFQSIVFALMGVGSTYKATNYMVKALNDKGKAEAGNEEE